MSKKDEIIGVLKKYACMINQEGRVEHVLQYYYGDHWCDEWPARHGNKDIAETRKEREDQQFGSPHRKFRIIKRVTTDQIIED